MPNEPDIERTSPGILASMLATDLSPTIWADDDLGSLLKYQLAAPLSFDLGLENPSTEERIEQLCAGAKPPVKTFDDVLHHLSPPLELLERIKDFAKFSLNAEESAMPQQIATLLYYAAIIAAQMRLNVSLTQLSKEALGEGLKWVVDQSWVDDRTRELFAEAIVKLR